MRLSKNFALAEITHSNTAKRLGINNEPTETHLQNMQHLVDNILQPLRDSIGPIRISSGYRNPSLNRAIGGSRSSQHCKGQALDIQFWQRGKMMNELIYEWILDSGLEFDQMINEFDFAWIHISLKAEDNRKQVLEAYKDEDGDTKYRYADV
jgi:4-hydroxy-3-methylbut-2-en-1-yl diphosphate synthase IspG/GcpE